MNKIFYTAIIIPSLTFGTSFVVEDGVTAPQQTLSDPGDTGLIEEGGTISVAASSVPGVRMFTIDQVVSNKGTITTTGFVSSGIATQLTGYQATIDNSGIITTTGLGSYGIQSLGTLVTIDNSGTIVSV